MRTYLIATLFFALPFVSAHAARPPQVISPATSEAIKDEDMVKAAVEMQPPPEDGVFKSLFPVAGYNPTYGVFAGGGYFRRVVELGTPVYEWSIMGIISQKKAVKLEFRTDRTIGGRWRLFMRNELGNGFESNFGLGNDTLTANRVDIDFWKNEIDLFIPYYVSPRFQVGPYLESRIRRNHSMDPAVLARQRDPIGDEEFSVAGGFKQVLDFRDIPENPSLGWMQSFRAVHGVPYRGPVKGNFTYLDAEIQLFQYIVAKELVVAYSLAGGVIFGKAPYLSQFRLGGTDRLRGFFYNRFRGSKYYVEQTELRFPIAGLFSGATFLEFGEVTEKHFSRANVSYGAGIRIGIPPDKLSKFRIDYAMSRDQKGVFVDFGHAF